MQKHLKKRYPSCHKIFSKNFFATNNFYKQSTYDIGKDCAIKPQAPLRSDQKPIFEVLVIEDTGFFGRKNLQMIAIDCNESPFFRQKLMADAKTSDAVAHKRSRKVAIYDLANGMITASGKNALTLEEVQKQTTFHELLAGAKWLNGEISYTEQELAYLKKKIRVVGKERFRNFFTNGILKPLHPRNLRALKTQPISQLMDLKVR
jgi:hypothetical protein